MSMWYNEGSEPALPGLGPTGWAVALVRLLLLAVVIYSLMVVLVLARLLEAPFNARALSPFVVQLASKLSLRVLGLGVRVQGRPMRHKGAVVANHASWLDIFALNAAARVFFVSKAEVSQWPAIGLIARTTGTVFIKRDPREAKAQKAQFEARLGRGDRLLFFPEGTSTDSRRVIPFKSTLFAAFFSPALRDKMWIQPASVVYTAPKGADPRFYGWWGDMEFGAHFLMVLGAFHAGSLEVIFHPPVRVADFETRKQLAAYCEAAVRAGLEGALAAKP